MKRVICWLFLAIPFASVASENQFALKNFFLLYEAGRKDNAVELVYLNNKDRNKIENYDGLVQTQQELTELTAEAGHYYGYELLGKHEIGKRLKHFSFLLLYENGPVRLEFEYYKPQKKWLLTDLNIDINLGEELKALARKDIAGYLVKDDITGAVEKKH